jgi:quercetin dioxygenase-like cupin family protein
MTVFRPGLAEPEAEVDVKIAAGLFIRSTTMRADTYVPQHSHAHDHVTVIAHGKVRIWRDGQLLGDYSAPGGLIIRAGRTHNFMALERSTVLCVHRIGHDGLPEILDPVEE